MGLGLVFAALVRVRPQAENLIAHVREGTGAFFGFQATILYWISAILGNISLAMVGAGYLGVFLSALKTPWNSALTSVVLLALMTAANLLGPRFVGRLSGLTVLLGLIPIFVVGVLGWLWFDPTLWARAWNPVHQPVLGAVTGSLVLVSAGLLGVESAAIGAKVIKDPERNLGPATVGGTAFATLVYIAACTVLFGLLPVKQLAASGAPFADAIARTLGPIGGAVLALCALAKSSGALGGWTLVTAETSESAADERMLLKIFAADGGPSPARKGLYINLALAAVVVIATVSPSAAKQYTAIVEIAAVANFAIYALACVALLRFTRSVRDRTLAIVALIFCIVVVAYSGEETLRLTAITLAATTALFVVMLITKALGRLRRQPA